MSKVKQAHVVPRFYLESFSGTSPRGQVWTYDKATNNAWSAKPEKTARRGHYYAVTKDDGEKDLTIENYFSDVEGEAKSGYQLLLEGKIPQDQVRADFSNFIAVQFSRTHTMRQFWAEGYCRYMHKRVMDDVPNDDEFNKIMDHREKETGEFISKERRDEIRAGISNPSNFIMRVPQDMTIRTLTAADDLMEVIYDMEWSIGYTENRYFITSDNPVAVDCDENLLRSQAAPKAIYCHPKTMIDFPLSPRSILVLTWQKMKVNFNVGDAGVLKANEERAMRAQRFLYAHTQDDAIKNLAHRYNGVKWGLRADSSYTDMPKVQIER